MGFLDFLKKQPPAAAPASAPTPPVAPPQGSAPQTEKWDPFASAGAPDQTTSVPDSTVNAINPAADAAAMPPPPANTVSDELPPLPPPSSPPPPLDLKEIERKINANAPVQSANDMDDMDDIPMPPEPMQDTQMLDDASKEFRVEKEMPKNTPASPDDIMAQLNASLEKEALSAKIEARAQPAPQIAPQPAAPIVLPDFTDEEIAEAESATGPQPLTPLTPPAAPSTPPPALPTATVKLSTQESVVAKPANAIAMPKGETITLSVGISIEADAVQPAKFVSSSDYFTIKSDIKAMRKTLRASDDQLKDGVLRHEQLDMQYKRVALDMNSIQDQLMKIDHALFEE